MRISLFVIGLTILVAVTVQMAVKVLDRQEMTSVTLVAMVSPPSKVLYTSGAICDNSIESHTAENHRPETHLTQNTGISTTMKATTKSARHPASSEARLAERTHTSTTLSN